MSRRGSLPKSAPVSQRQRRLLCELLEDRRVLAAFTLGDVVALRVGSGSLLTDAAAPVFLDEFTTSGAAVQSIAVPTTGGGSNHALTLSGNVALEGSLRRSFDGRFLTFGGYDAAVGTAAVADTAAATNNRVIARVAASGTVDTTTVMDDAYTAGTISGIRGVATVDGSAFWTSGQGDSGLGGVRYVTYGNTGSSNPIGILPTNKFNNTRAIGIFGGQLYTSVRTGMVTEQGIAAVGTGLPTSAGSTSVMLPNVSSANEAVGYALLDLNPAVSGVDTLYVADQVSGLLKYSFDGTNWSALGSISGSMFGLTAIVGTSGIEIYATSGSGPGNSLVKVVDSSGPTGALSGSATVIATAPANTSFRGVAMAPGVASGANLQPTLDAIANPAAINEDAGQQSVNLLGISAGAGETQTISITATSSNTSLVSSVSVNYTSPNAVGSLSYTPRANANGSTTITVTVKDNGGTANGGVDTLVRTFTVNVNAVNDAPIFALIGNNLGAVQEDSGTHTIPGFAGGIGRGPATATDELSQSLTFNTSISNTSGGMTFEIPPTIDSSGQLTYKAAPDASGTATITVTLTDSGSGVPPSVNTSAPQQFTLSVNGINDPPSFSLGSDPPASAVNGGLQTVPNYATDILPGASPEEAGQTLTFDLVILGTTGNLVFSQAPAIDPSTGTLTYQAAPNTQGTATVSVVLHDDGPATPPHSNVSAALLFTITVSQFPWQSSPNPLDVDEDGAVSGIDLIYIVEGLNTPGTQFLPQRTPPPTKKIDVNGDNFVSALDLVLLVEALNGSSSPLNMAPASAAIVAEEPSAGESEYAWSLGWTGSDDEEEVVALLAAATVSEEPKQAEPRNQVGLPAVSTPSLMVARRGSGKAVVNTSAQLDCNELAGNG